MVSVIYGIGVKLLGSCLLGGCVESGRDATRKALQAGARNALIENMLNGWKISCSYHRVIARRCISSTGRYRSSAPRLSSVLDIASAKC